MESKRIAQELHDLGILSWFDVEHNKERIEALLVLHELTNDFPTEVLEELYKLLEE